MTDDQRRKAELAVSAGWDAAERQRITAGRTRWNEDDYNLATRETNRLRDLWGLDRPERIAP